jgi:hypothetical protein
VPRSREEEITRLGANSSLERNRTADFVNCRFLNNGLKLYRPAIEGSPMARGANWYAENLPPTFMAYGTAEVLFDSFTKWEHGLRAGNLDLTTVVGIDEVHIWNILEEKYSKDKLGWDDSCHTLVAWMERLSRGASDSKMVAI